MTEKVIKKFNINGLNVPFDNTELNDKTKILNQNEWVRHLYEPTDYWYSIKEKEKTFIILSQIKGGDNIYYEIVEYVNLDALCFGLYNIITGQVEKVIGPITNSFGEYNVPDEIDSEQYNLCLLQNNSQNKDLSIRYTLNKNNLLNRDSIIDKVSDNKSTIDKLTGDVQYINSEFYSTDEIDEIVTDDAIVSIGSFFDEYLMKNKAPEMFVTYMVDVTNYIGSQIYFKSYSNISVKGYNGIILQTGEIVSVYKTEDYQNFQILDIPYNAKTVCITWATSLGEQTIRVFRKGKLSLREEIDNLKNKPNDNTYKNIELLNMPLIAMRDKITINNYNRVLISINGDSILGSQLEAITKSPEYYTGDFPPNMSKMTMGRLFYDRYKFDDEDTIFRNLIHSDWVKRGFDISNGKEEPSQTFNQIEVYGANEGDFAEITVTGYAYIKFVWSEYKNSAYSFKILQSINDAEYTHLYDVIKQTTEGVIQKYIIFELNSNDNYKFKIEPITGHNNICFWGVELWNKPRLDVVVEAFSGRTAKHNRERYLDGYYSEWHKPWLVITNVLSLNDYSYIKSAGYTFEDWRKDNTYLYDFCKSNGTQVLAICSHNIPQNYPTVNMSRGLVQMCGLPYIDILQKLKDDKKTISTSDGIHLSNDGISYYFDEIKKIFDSFLNIQ